MRDTAIILTAIAVIAGLSFFIGRKTARNGDAETITETMDTLLIRDTIVSYRPVFVTKRIVDSVYVPVRETITERDTVFVIMAREQVTWEDSLARVYASGIDPQVDSVIHYRDRMVVTKETVIRIHSRLGFGIQGGVGVGRGGLTPYVGLGVHYDIVSW